jgi:fructosamine-3-kinase
MSRRTIYSWKCDRPGAFHGTTGSGRGDARIEASLAAELRAVFDAADVRLSPGAGQGNHLTWNADVNGTAMFVRVENGPENDGQLAVESAVLDRVRAVGVPTPRVHACDASRTRVPFAWQALQRLEVPDLNHWFKRGELDWRSAAHETGAAVARWQALAPAAFGPLEDPSHPRGCHALYEDYFRLRLDEHLHFLVEKRFLTAPDRDAITKAVDEHASLLALGTGVLVHKDLALWNILGSRDRIAAFIDFDDAISGDPLDDLSLLACFHDGAFMRAAFAGYASVRPLPDGYRRRLWLHLLRNMIVKAVIRVGAGYFDRDAGFFLIGAGESGRDLRRFTEKRITIALHGLRTDEDFDIL